MRFILKSVGKSKVFWSFFGDYREKGGFFLCGRGDEGVGKEKGTNAHSKNIYYTYHFNGSKDQNFRIKNLYRYGTSFFTKVYSNSLYTVIRSPVFAS